MERAETDETSVASSSSHLECSDGQSSTTEPAVIYAAEPRETPAELHSESSVVHADSVMNIKLGLVLTSILFGCSALWQKNKMDNGEEHGINGMNKKKSLMQKIAQKKMHGGKITKDNETTETADTASYSKPERDEGDSRQLVYTNGGENSLVCDERRGNPCQVDS